MVHISNILAMVDHLDLFDARFTSCRGRKKGKLTTFECIEWMRPIIVVDFLTSHAQGEQMHLCTTTPVNKKRMDVGYPANISYLLVYGPRCRHVLLFLPFASQMLVTTPLAMLPLSTVLVQYSTPFKKHYCPRFFSPLLRLFFLRILAHVPWPVWSGPDVQTRERRSYTPLFTSPSFCSFSGFR